MTSSTTEQVIQNSTAASYTTFLDSQFRYVLFPVVYGIIFIVGIIANTYVLFVLRSLREAKAMGEIRIYMTNLTIADLLFVCGLPFWVGYYSRGGNWVYTDIMCRLTGVMFYINTYCSILFLGAISVNRYWAVTRPLDAASSDHRRRGIVISVVIWMTVVLLTVPQVTSPGTNFDNTHNITRCFEGYQNRTEFKKKLLASTHFAIIGVFFVVFSLVVVCNFLIARALLSQNAPQSESTRFKTLSRKSNLTMSSADNRPRGVKRRALQMLWAVVGVFALCFLPHHVVQGPWTLAVLQIREGWGHVTWEPETLQALNDAHQITWVLVAFNCILDPVVYFFATRKFRRYIKTHVKKFVKGEGCSHTTVSQMDMDSKNHSQRLQGERPQPNENLTPDFTQRKD